jgi:hypothetical protein
MNDEVKAKITKKFQERRSEVSKEIYSNIEKLSNLKTLKEAQVNMLSLRQRLLEDNHTIFEHLTALRKKYRDDRSIEMENLSRNLQIRYQANEKTVSFFTESIKTIDNIIFGIKTRIDIEKTLGL